MQDLLISVTNFFRDREVFEILEQHHIPELFRDKNQSHAIRVWVPACATGEEAYLIAIQLLEHARRRDASPALQVFACDLHDEAIPIARAGRYPDTITADVSEERLRRFFVKEHNGYCVRRELREMVLFAVHDLLKDAPFSRMDLISCRNLLIYLNRDAQKRVFEAFHFALKPGGRLLLGASEAIEDGSPLFHALDKKHRIDAHQPAVRIGLQVPGGPSSLLRVMELRQQAASAPAVHGKRFAQHAGTPFLSGIPALIDRTTLAELHFKMIERYAPPSVLVDAEHEIMHLSEHAGEFLRFGGGEPTTNLVRVVHPSLRVDVRAALFRAAESNATAETFDVPTEIDGQPEAVDIRVTPAPEVSPGFMLVVFNLHDRAGGHPPAESDPAAAPETVVRHLERELELVKGHLRATVEQ